MHNLNNAMKAADYPEKADITKINKTMILLLLFILAIYHAMIFAPIGAMLAELFPTRIRYTALSIPYHVLWIVVSCVTGVIFIKETKGVDIHSDI